MKEPSLKQCGMEMLHYYYLPYQICRNEDGVAQWFSTLEPRRSTKDETILVAQYTPFKLFLISFTPLIELK